MVNDPFAAMCSLAAAVQGMDETVNNGAQALYLTVGDRSTPLVAKGVEKALQ